MSLRRLVATLGLAATGVSCAKAVNYLDPSGPLYSTPARRDGRRADRGAVASSRQLQHRVRDRDRPRDRGAARDRGPPRSGRPGPPGDGRPGHGADRQGARDERGLLPERSAPEAPSRLRERDPVALAARGAAKDPAAARRPGLGPAALGGLGRGRPRGAADPRRTRSTCLRPWPSRAARARRSCGRSPRTRPRRKGRSSSLATSTPTARSRSSRRPAFSGSPGTWATRRGWPSWGSGWGASPTTTC